MKATSTHRRRRVLGKASLAFGLLVATFLWFAPGLVTPVVAGPLFELLRLLGMVGEAPLGFEAGFTVVLVLRWVTTGLLIAFVLLGERRPLSSIGLRRMTRRDVLWALAVGVIASVAVAITYSLAWGAGGQSQNEEIITRLSLLGSVHLVLNAAVVEEVFFRGYLIERVSALTGRLWLAGAASFLAFTVSHIGGSGLIQALVAVSIGSAAYTLFYLWRRNLPACVLIHALVDAPILLL